MTTPAGLGKVSVQSDVFDMPLDGRSVRVSTWVKANQAGLTFRFHLVFLDGAGNPSYRAPSPVTLVNGEFQELAYVASATAGSVSVQVKLQAGGEAGKYFFDNVCASAIYLKATYLVSILSISYLVRRIKGIPQ